MAKRLTALAAKRNPSRRGPYVPARLTLMSPRSTEGAGMAAIAGRMGTERMGEIFIGLGANGERQVLNLKRANRHGLVAGATGTGKTVTLQGIAESFSAEGVPVFLADVKGDLSGISMPGSPTFKNAAALEARAKELGMDDYAYSDNPAVFWDLYGEQGHPIRTTISEMGPLLLARLLDLNETQEGVLNIVFRFADEQGLLLLDMKDLQAMLAYTVEHAAELTTKYGNVTKQSIGTIQRQLLSFESQGADKFFGEPALEITDFLKVDEKGRGYINVLAADRLMQSPKLYATFLLWLLAELFEVLPEVGDPEKPKLVFFFDEAHLLFDDAPKALLDKIEQVVRLIRSKGVGVYFITQNPADVPDTILGQLGNRVQHALRAFTAKDQKDLAKAAETYRPNPRFRIDEAIRDVGTGEAVTSLLEAKGVPGVAERTLVRPPSSQLGPLDPAARAAVMAGSPVKGKYDQPLDRESAFEKLRARAGSAARDAAQLEQKQAEEKREFERARRYDANGYREAAPKRTSAGRSDSIGTAFAKSFARQLGTKSGQALVRGILGSIFGKR